MAFDFSVITGNPLFLGVVFIVFVLAIKRVTRILLNCVWITVGAVMFPIIANKMLGFAVPIDADSIIFFITVGLGAYFVFLLASSIYRVLAVAEREGRPIISFLGSVISNSREKLSSGKKDSEFKKKEEELKKKEQEMKRKEDQIRQIEKEERRRAEERFKEIEEKSRGYTKPAKKDNFDDYLIIEDEEAKEEQKETKEEPKKEEPKHKQKDKSVIKKFREAKD